MEVEGRWFASTQSSFFSLLMFLMPSLLLLVHILADSLLRPFQVDVAYLADLEFKPLKIRDHVSWHFEMPLVKGGHKSLGMEV